MTFEEFIDSVVSFVGVRRWNKYVADPVDRMLTKVENKAQEYGPKIEAYIDTHIGPKFDAAVNYLQLHSQLMADNIDRRVDAIVDTMEYVSVSIQDADAINYAVKALILGAVIDMEHRIIIDAESKDWEGISDTDYELIRIGDHIIATETLDIAELEEDIVVVKATDGSQNRIPLSKIIGD